MIGAATGNPLVAVLGFAGGILCAAMDGQNVARAIAAQVRK